MKQKDFEQECREQAEGQEKAICKRQPSRHEIEGIFYTGFMAEFLSNAFRLIRKKVRAAGLMTLPREPRLTGTATSLSSSPHSTTMAY